ncbi:hypothetical protein [Actinomyces radicidentis]|uniref:hypothetical protein n=1 Tax=Actinomyces radicidentis TaxID=111015 RepID=UPI0028E2077A|nr:hypothetical protein [Actinomyces radicidentis]
MTRSVPRRTRALAAAGALVLAGPALAGCSAHPGQAATASYDLPDGTHESVTITENQVQSAATQLKNVQGLTSDAVLTDLIWLPAYEKVGKEHGITVTDDDARSALDSAKLDASSASQTTIDVVRSVLYSNAFSSLDQDTLAKVAVEFQDIQDSSSIKASPRYDTRRDFLDTTGSSSVKVG